MPSLAPDPSTRRPASPGRPDTRRLRGWGSTVGLVIVALGSLVPGAAAAAGTAVPGSATPSASAPASSSHLTRLAIPAVPAGKRAGVSSSGDPIAAATTEVGIPFDVAGVTFSGPAPDGMGVEVRTRTSGGWGPWLPLELDSDDGPDPGSSEARRQKPGSVPLTAAGSDGVDVRVSTRDGSVPPDLAVTVVDAAPAPTTTSKADSAATDSST